MSGENGRSADGKAARPEGGGMPKGRGAHQGAPRAGISMDNTEIRLRILFGCYAELYHGQPEMEWLNSLEGVPESVVKANMMYLVDANLVTGIAEKYAGGRPCAHIGRILPGGVNIVEAITRRSVARLDGSESDEIRDAPDRQLAFWEKCVNVAKVCAVAVEVTGQILSAIR